MSVASTLKEVFGPVEYVIQAYLEDLSEADLLKRPAPGANHLAWQLGHLIAAEQHMIELMLPGTLPALPEGFAAQHSKETSTSDDPRAFLTRQQYLDLHARQHAALLAALDKLSDSDLAKPSPENFQMLGPTVGSLIGMQATHWMMHAGQWAILRRQLGLPVKV